MRVGLLSPVAPETIGGGYTFEHEIFERVLECAATSKHELVVFERLKGRRAEIASPNLKRVVLRRPFVANVSSALNSVPRTLRLRPKRPYRCENKWIGHILKREKIEFFLNISPLTVSLEIPFLAIVWDLQHRLQPFFPEVSSGGTWQRREDDFSEALQRAAFVITGTQASKNEVQSFYGVPDERIRILPHPTPRFALEGGSSDLAELTKYKLPQDYIFYPAQFWSHKNHVGLLQALFHLKQADNLRLPVVFTGSDQGNERYVRQVVQTLQLREQVFFLGHVPQHALPGLYQRAFVLCYPSFFGPENLPPLEAFALGCPVIAADVPGASEQLGDAAILVDPANELDIAQAIKSLFDDKAKRENLIRRGKERAVRFTGRDFARSLFGLLDEFEPVRRCWAANS
jgi:glycosyltransferase involved in cell wall biosynthesis